MMRPQNADPVVWLGLVAIAVLAACGGRGGGSQLVRIRADAPDEVLGWRASDRGEVYDSESIFSYIDGHAEVYLAYGMKHCLAMRYGGPEGEADIVLDVFELASPADAYGVFTYDRDGEAVDIGHDALFRYGWLSYWKGPLFVSVTAEVESPAARAAVLAIGDAVATLIESDGEPPSIVAELPENGLDPGSIRYLRSQQILDTHLWLGEGDLLGLGPDTEAVLARYLRNGGSAHLLLVDYPGEDRAERAAAAARERLAGSDPGGGPRSDQAGRWYSVKRRGVRLVLIVGAATEELAAGLLDDVS
jgi:hypothetical protein